MTNARRITLPLHVASAKSVQIYMDENGGDATAALNAAQRDVTQREGQNSSARGFQRAYAKLVEHLKLSATPEDAEAASDAALSIVRGLSEAGSSSAQLQATLKTLELDPVKLSEQVAELRAQAANGAKTAGLEKSIAYRDAADHLKYDAGRLQKILRDEPLPPQLRVTKASIDGKETDVTNWGFPRIDAAGKETAFVRMQEHPELLGFEAALRKTPESGAPITTPTFQSPIMPTQRQGTPLPAGAQPLDPAATRADIDANGAGRI